jgi:Recombination endonuclease VII
MPYKDPTSDAAKASLKRRRQRYFDSHGGYTEVAKSYASRHPNALRNSYYKCIHGVTLEEFEAQIERQHGLCPIGNHPFGPRGRGRNSPCQDHDHETDENRLILCREHNVGLGQFHDSIEELESAIFYLKQYKAVAVPQ